VYPSLSNAQQEIICEGTSFNQPFTFGYLLLLFLWLYSHLLGLGRFFSFLILYTVGRIPWMGDQPVAMPLSTHRTTQTQNKRTQISIPRVRFEPTIPAFKRAKTVHALHRAAILMGSFGYNDAQITRYSKGCRFFDSVSICLLFHRLPPFL
jgi:hypothetical protein